jgi:hypothetical protein
MYTIAWVCVAHVQCVLQCKKGSYPAYPWCHINNPRQEACAPLQGGTDVRTIAIEWQRPVQTSRQLSLAYVESA